MVVIWKETEDENGYIHCSEHQEDYILSEEKEFDGKHTLTEILEHLAWWTEEIMLWNYGTNHEDEMIGVEHNAIWRMTVSI